jgi:hypothetical protein
VIKEINGYLVDMILINSFRLGSEFYYNNSDPGLLQEQQQQQQSGY